MRLLRWGGLLLAAGNLLAQTAASGPPTIGKCTVLPADNIWNTPIDTLPVDSHSAAYIASIGSTSPVRYDMTMPFVAVPGTQPKVPVIFSSPTESDPGPYPIPSQRPGGGKRHAGRSARHRHRPGQLHSVRDVQIREAAGRELDRDRRRRFQSEFRCFTPGLLVLLGRRRAADLSRTHEVRRGDGRRDPARHPLYRAEHATVVRLARPSLCLVPTPAPIFLPWGSGSASRRASTSPVFLPGCR